MFLFRVFLRGLCFKYFLSYIIIKTRCTCLTIFSPVQFKTRRRPASRPSPRAPAPCWGIQTESCSATSGARLPGQDVLELDIELVLLVDHEGLLDHLLRHVRGELRLHAQCPGQNLLSSLHPGPHNAALPVDVRHRLREPPRRTHGPRICGGAIRKSRACHAVLRAARRVFVATQGPDAPRTLN